MNVSIGSTLSEEIRRLNTDMKKSVAVIVGAVLFVSTVIVAVNTDEYRKEHSGKDYHAKQEKLITIGFSQVGAESNWRTANSISIKQTFTPERGYDLLFEDAKQKQSNQIMAIRRFIQQEVDYIVFSPVVETGWDTVLEEAKRAGIPVIIIDRRVSVRDTSLYKTWIGSDFYLEGQKACKALMEYVELNQIPEVNIVNIQGTEGATAQIGRSRALEDAAEKYGWNLLAQESGEYTEAKAYEVMTKLLNEYEDINFVYCENDNEAFGAIDAIQDAGKSVGPGGDIQIISFDATQEGLRRVQRGEILINAECNPWHGYYVEKAIYQIEKGEGLQKEWNVPEEVYVYMPKDFDVMLGGKTYTPPVPFAASSACSIISG